MSAGPTARSRAIIRLRPPSVASEFEAIGGVENHALALEKLALDQIAAGFGARADLAARVDDPVPGYAALGRERVQCVTDLPRVAAETRELGDLPIGGDATARDAPHHRVDPVVVASTRLHARQFGAVRWRGRAARGIRLARLGATLGQP